MSRAGYVHRSKEAPMDYEWTNRATTQPAWSHHSSEDSSTPRKRQFGEVNPGTLSVSTIPSTPTFGRNQNVPFLFNQVPLPQTPQSPAWDPFQVRAQQGEIHDVDMNEVTPSKSEEASSDETRKEEVEEADEARPIALGALQRVFKRRSKKRNARARSRRLEDDDDSGIGSTDEDEAEVALRHRKTSNHYTLNMAAPPPTPSHAPYVLLGYLQLFFNLSLILLFLYLVVQFILTVQRDVEKRISEYSQDIVQDIAVCNSQYKANYCHTPQMAPAMVQQCSYWESCMNRDPTNLGRAKVSAELIAEVINGFVEPITWKTLIFTLTSLAFLTVFINALLSLYRSKYQPIAAPLQPSTSYPLLPAGPYPSHHLGSFMSPVPTASWGRLPGHDEGLESPTRRRRLKKINLSTSITSSTPLNVFEWSCSESAGYEVIVSRQGCRWDL